MRGKRKKYCLGCYNDFYNNNNNLGVQECWSFKDAKVVWKKQVSIHQVPPWHQKAKRVFNCYHKTGYVFVDPERRY